MPTHSWAPRHRPATPRLIKGRTHGPVFTTHRKPGPGKVLGPRCVPWHRPGPPVLRPGPHAPGRPHRHQRPGTGWDLHEFRHSALTHLGEAGASLLELLAKSRHRKPDNLKRYFRPFPQALREITSLLAPGADRR